MTLWNDLRIGARSWLGAPGSAVVIVLTLALGIGLNTAIFSLVYAVLLRPLPYRDSGQLVSLSSINLETGNRDKVSGADLADWQRRSTTFQDFATYWDTAFTLAGEVPTTLPSWEVSPNLFTMLGTPALVGRTLLLEDGRPGNPRVVVLSHRLWLQRFGANTNAIGQRLLLQRADGVGPAEASYEIVGVMPPDFAHPSPAAALWAPLTADLSQNRRLPVLQVLARLRPDVTIRRADDELKGIAAALASDYPETNSKRTAEVRRIRDIYSGDVQASLWVLQGAAFALLLIACTNVANLLLARAIARVRQVAIQLAMGATRWRLFRQSLGEMVVLAIGGSIAGMLLAVWGLELLPRLFESQLTNLRLPVSTSEWMTPSVLAAVAGLTAAICVTMSILQVFRGENAAALVMDSARVSGAPRWAMRARAGFIVGQIAVSLCLLVAAGLLVRSFIRLQDRSLGFETENVLTGFFFLPPTRYTDLTQREVFLRELTAQLRALPGAQGAAVISTLPLTGADARRPYQVRGTSRREDQWTQYRVVTPQYFDVMGIPLRRGRFFTDRDRTGSTDVAIINEHLARTLWPAEDPIGKVLLVPDMAPPARPQTVIGVVGDVRHQGPATDIPLELYRPAYQTSWPFFSVVVRTAGNPEQSISAARSAMASLDRTVDAGASMRPFSELAADSVRLRRASMTIVSLFAVIALALALIGVYSLIAYVVAQRTREFGVRLALGAPRAHIYATVFRHGLAPVFAGIGVGVASALAGTRVLQTMLFEVTPYDPVTFVVVAVTFFTVATVGMLIPTRRAARLNPVAALRHD